MWLEINFLQLYDQQTLHETVIMSVCFFPVIANSGRSTLSPRSNGLSYVANGST